MTATESKTEFLHLRIKALEEENKRLKQQLQQVKPFIILN